MTSTERIYHFMLITLVMIAAIRTANLEHAGDGAAFSVGFLYLIGIIAIALTPESR